MFKATLEDVSLLRDSIATISELIEEARFKIKKDGIELLAADRAVVAVVDFKFSSKNFKEYHHQSDSNIGINLNNFLQVLKRARANDILLIELEENSLSLTLKGRSRRKFTIPLLEIREEVPSGIEKLTFPAKVVLSSELLADGIEDADLVSDSVIIELDKDKFLLKAQGDSSSSELELKAGEECKIETKEKVRARYSIDYLKKMLKAKKLSENVEIALNTNYPLKMTFAQDKLISLSFILAPRVEE